MNSKKKKMREKKKLKINDMTQNDNCFLSMCVCVCVRKNTGYIIGIQTQTHTNKQIMGCIAYHETMAELGAIAVCGD